MQFNVNKNAFLTTLHFFTKSFKLQSYRVWWRQYSINCSSLIYSSFGDPLQVLKKMETKLENLGKSDILVEMLASPINPADINMIQGVYAIKPTLPAIGGNEGLARVIDSRVPSFKTGDLVVPALAGFGTWRTHAICKEDDLIKVDSNLPIISAATMFINPSTSYRMLKDFVQLDEGDVVIQNGANSSVGQAVIQMCRFFKLRTINIIRSRPNVEELISYLKSIGATHVITEEFLRGAEMKNLLSQMPKPKLGLNTVGGKSAAEVVKHIKNGGTLVTYGGMSKQPAMIPTGALIFNDIHVRGFWMSRWTTEHKHSSEQKEMFNDITDMIKSKSLLPPLYSEIPFSNFELAIRSSMEPFLNKKQILLFS